MGRRPDPDREARAFMWALWWGPTPGESAEETDERIAALARVCDRIRAEREMTDDIAFALLGAIGKRKAG